MLTLGPYELLVDISAGREPVAVDPLSLDPAPRHGAAASFPTRLATNRFGHGRADRAPDPLDLLDDANPGGGDFLDDLLGPDRADDGPGQFSRTEEDPFDQLLAPLGTEDDPFLPSDAPEVAGDDRAR